MNDPNGQIDFADLDAIGAHMVQQLQRFGAMESVVPGATLDWGIQIGARAFALSVRVMRPSEVHHV